jgi:hypothetical protein
VSWDRSVKHRVGLDRFAGTSGVLLLGEGDQEGSGVLGVADGGLGVEAEHRCQVQGVGAVGEGFLELPIDTEPFQGRGVAAEFLLGEEEPADRAGARRGLLVERVPVALTKFPSDITVTCGDSAAWGLISLPGGATGGGIRGVCRGCEGAGRRGVFGDFSIDGGQVKVADTLS